MAPQITVFGATGRTGKRVVDQAVKRGWKIVGVAHDGADPTRENVTYFKADVLNDDLTAMIEGSDAVISCLGLGNDPATLINPPPLYSKGTRRIVSAMNEVGVDRLAVISASFVETWDRGPLHFRAILPGLSLIFEQMKQMERFLERQLDLKWTAVRPGWIMDAEPSGRAQVVDRVIPQDLIRSRTGDIAGLLIDCIADEEGANQRWIRAKPAIASPEADEHTSVIAVANEVL